MADYTFSQGFISKDPETLGFDLTSGTKWIYPENYPRRDYQFSIVQTSLYSNTLVCLPTGLEKTFIAAVVMYNFWRWYPRGKVVFLAPTKPLVAQQIQACHKIMGIPSEQTIELTGAINQTKRRQAWTEKRVIFATPQTFQKDLQNSCVPFDLVKCVVIDEAHKALGKHSYCEIIKMLYKKNKYFRVLGLSATPGSKMDHVREVIQNLLISELELRDDSSSDIQPYTNNRNVEKIIVYLDRNLIEFKNRYIKIMDPHVRVLVSNHILQGSTANISKGRIFMLKRQYDARPQKANNHKVIAKTFTILHTMYHAYELLIKHGLRSFYHFYMNHSDKFWMNSELDLKLLLEEIKNHIGEFPVIQPQSDGIVLPDVPEDLVFGHNKFNVLQKLLVDHFMTCSSKNQQTKAIVFVEYRDIVNEVYVLLLQKKPLLRPQMFVGQAGLKQKQQLAALENFRNNHVNVLISTSVGEEGLDVGEVDLIVCFDISSSTPIRLVQRMGRTGRMREGRVVLLLTEGKETQTLNQALSKKDTMNAKILQSSNIASSLYQSSPRMIPENLNPECHAIFIKTQLKSPNKKSAPTSMTTETGGKKKRKRRPNISKSDNTLSELQPSTSQATISPKKTCVDQSCKMMMKYLLSSSSNQSCQKSTNSSKSKETNSSDSSIYEEKNEFVIPRDINDPYANLRPTDVPLITNDSIALEFLTLCAMKRSELKYEEENSETREEILRRNWFPIKKKINLNPEIAKLKIPPLESIQFISWLELFKENDSDVIVLDNSDSNNESLPSNNPRWSGDDDRVQSSFDNSIFLGDNDNLFPLESKYRAIEPSPEVTATINELDEARIEVGFDSLLDDDMSSSFKEKDFDKKIPENEKEKKHNNIFDDLLLESNDFNEKIKEEEHHNIFDDLLAESSDSDEKSLKHSEEPNIFDDLLNASDEEENLFANLDSPVENETKIQNQDGVLESTKIIKDKPSAKRTLTQRSSIDSPVNKRQRLLRENDANDSSDNEAIQGTPTKPSKYRNSQKFINNDKPTVFYPDSEEDIFDDLDFETQFSPDKKLDENNSAVKINDDKSEKIDRSMDFDEEKKNKEIKTEEMVEMKVEQVKIKDNDDQLDSKDDNKLLTCDLELEDWDDYDINPFAVSTSSVSEEKFSKFFDSPSKSSNNSSSGNNKKSLNLSKPQVFASTGWISSGSQPKKMFQQKFSLKSKIGDKKFCSQQSSTNSGNDFQKNFNAQIDNNRSSLQFFNRKNTGNIDKDGFAVPMQSFLKSSNVEKENARPLPIETVSTDGLFEKKRYNNKPSTSKNISPRFRKYHSESSLDKCNDTNRKKNTKRRRKKNRRKLINEFIDEEAEVSSDCESSSGNSGEDDDDDQNLNGFVSYSQNCEDAIDMRAHYLQTMNRSDNIRRGAFVIKEVKQQPQVNFNIYSQPVSQTEDHYLHDSFCVGDEVDTSAEENDASPDDLENIECILENKRKKKKKKLKGLQSKGENNYNEKELKKDGSDSSEDETEALRRQVLEESFLLKK